MRNLVVGSTIDRPRALSCQANSICRRICERWPFSGLCLSRTAHWTTMGHGLHGGIYRRVGVAGRDQKESPAHVRDVLYYAGTTRRLALRADRFKPAQWMHLLLNECTTEKVCERDRAATRSANGTFLTR